MEKLTKVGVWGVQGMAEEKYNFQNDQNWAKILCNYMWTNPDDLKAKFFLWKLGIFWIKFLDDFNTLKNPGEAVVQYTDTRELCAASQD